MKTIVLFGAGKSATVLIDYLKQLSAEKKWNVFVADSDLRTVKSKVGRHTFTKAVQVNIENETERHALIKQADVVISLLPPSLHYLLAVDCIQFNKHLLTASYISEEIKKLASAIKNKKLLFLCEMGLDPGIDHMSAMKLIHQIKESGGNITSFKSHCGGLVAPESDNNPWHYKISWNPRNVVMAGKAGAVYKEDGKIIHKQYEELFMDNKKVMIPSLGELAYYPNRDSLDYMSLYDLENADTFLRTTLRYPEFCRGWKNMIDLKMTDEEKVYDTSGLNMAVFFEMHLRKYDLQYLVNALGAEVEKAQIKLAEKLMLLQEERNKKSEEQNFFFINEQGKMSDSEDYIAIDPLDPDVIKMQETALSMEQLFYLGFDEEEFMIDKGLCSAADVLQLALEKKLALERKDKDMIVMMHEIEYTFNGQHLSVNSSLIVKGENNLRTAMAKTVGLPLGIAAKLILEEKITETGLHIPVVASVYEPVLKELEMHGIIFNETK